MKSPFPGMDPYIEACVWGDFHTHLIEAIYQFLAEVAPERYLVRTGERSYLVLIESRRKKKKTFLPDVKVTTLVRGKKRTKTRSSAAVAVAEAGVEPLNMRAFIEEEHREAFVEIYEADADERLVTSIEVLSPSNKRPGTEGWDVYLRKRRGLMLGGVNLVEIDLLRGGQRMPMLDPWPECPYTMLIARAWQCDMCRAWSAYSLRPLPPLPVPLAKPDPDISIDLQPMIEAIYARSRYYRSIDYSKPLTPPLSDEEAKWLEQELP